MSLLEVDDIKTYFFGVGGTVKAVDGVSFDLQEEHSFGIAGESGCGKTTLAMSILRLVLPPGRVVSGRVILNGRDILKLPEQQMRQVRGKEIAMVLQGSMNALDPLCRIDELMIEPLVVNANMEKRKALEKTREMLEKVGIEKSRGRNYPHELSGGMKQRVMIAMMLALSSRVIILDEPATALDVITQRQILELMKSLKREFRLSCILITHDISILAELSDEIMIMYGGRTFERASTEVLLENPMNPYTKALIAAFPRIDGPRTRLEGIPGSPPNLIDPPPGCRFYPRCSYSKDVCRRSEPNLVQVEKDHYVACCLYPDSQ